MIDLKYTGNGFTFQICDSYAVTADNVEEAKSELFDKIEKDIDEYVNNRLSSIVGDEFIIDFDDDLK